MARELRGYFAIGLTPFDAIGNLQWDEFAAELDWIVRAGAHGLVWPVNNSEFYCLSDAEKRRGFDLMVDRIDGRIPTVAGVADTSVAGAMSLAEAAAESGADSLVAMPPWAIKMHDENLILDYYRRIAEAAPGLPVMVQNLDGWVGSSLSSELVVRICGEIETVCYVKEERNPHGVSVSDLIAKNDGAIQGVFTGGHLLGMVQTHRRGAVGCIASADQTDLCAQIWDLMEVGAEIEAHAMQQAEAVLAKAIRDMSGLAAHKEVMVRRGFFSCNGARNRGPVTFDEVHSDELDRALDLLNPMMKD